MLSKSLKDTEKIAEDFLTSLRPNSRGATVVGLGGDLGSGKTTFTKFVARHLGIAETITSPTFVIEKIYKTDSRIFKKLVHIDSYRLDGARDLNVLGWEEILSDPTNLVLIEWPENVKGALPEGSHEIKFTFLDESTRDIEINNGKD